MHTLTGFGFTAGVLPANCPTRTVLDHVTSKWGVLVLIALSQQSLRWGELRRTIEGISEKMLASTLRTRRLQPHPAGPRPRRAPPAADGVDR
jgi:DNA-binding HxlR family transcriptional regulator